MGLQRAKGCEEMLNIRPVKTIQGKIDLPPSPDLFLLAAITALASQRTIRVKSTNNSPVMKLWLDILKDHANITTTDTSITIDPFKDDPSSFILIPHDILPYRDVIVYTLLSMGKVVAFKSIGNKRLEAIVKKAKKFGFIVEISKYGTNSGLSLKESPDIINQSINVIDEDVAPLAGLLLGQHKSAIFQVDFHFAHPLRNILPLFGAEI